MREYEFSRRTLDIPDNVKGSMTFSAPTFRAALQMACQYWFGVEMSDYVRDSNGVITLLDNAPSQTAWGGNVIGTLMDNN